MKSEKNMNDEFELLMLHLNEIKDKKVVDEILSTKQGCKQLEKLQNDMNNIEQKINQYEIGDEYGSKLWDNIVSRLDAPTKAPLFHQWINSIFRPQFSIFGLVAIFTIAVSFYFIGHNNALIINESNSTTTQRLLAKNMKLHLTQTDIFLTQVSNMSSQYNSPALIKSAESLLASNRIYKNAYTNNDNKRLKNLLIELEQVLLEVSNGDIKNSQNYISEYANNQLLYKVKSSKQQIKSQLSNQQDTSI